MEQYLITIKDNKKQKFIQDLLNELDFIEVRKIKASKKSKFISEFISALQEIELHEKGNKELKSAEQFLNELPKDYTGNINL